MSGLLLRRDGEQWHEPSSTGYTNEAALQDMLAEHPSLIPGVSSGAVVCKEFQSTAGSADIVVFDSHGGLTIVECKLDANREARREIIGQILDYASKLWQMHVDDFDAQWTKRTKVSLFSDPETADSRRTELETLLDQGRFRIVLAVDEISDDLRRIVEYLNSITLPEVAVIAVSYRRVQDGDVEIITPAVFGQELAEAKNTARRSQREPWTIAEYLSWIEVNQPNTSATAEEFIRALIANGYVIEGGRGGTPSLLTRLDTPTLGSGTVFSLNTYSTWATIEFGFANFKDEPAAAEVFLLAASSTTSTDLDPATIRQSRYAKRPNTRLAGLTPDDARRLVSDVTRSLMAFRHDQTD